MAIVAVVLIIVIGVTIILEAKKGRSWNPFVIHSPEEEAFLRCRFNCYDEKVPGWNGDWSKLHADARRSCEEACRYPRNPRYLVAHVVMLIDR